MVTKSKPVRIFAADDHALEALTRLRGQSRAGIIHEALSDYVRAHRDELSQLYTETQQALAAGDVDQLARVSAGARRAEVDAAMATMPAYQ